VTELSIGDTSTHIYQYVACQSTFYNLLKISAYSQYVTGLWYTVCYIIYQQVLSWLQSIINLYISYRAICYIIT